MEKYYKQDLSQYKRTVKNQNLYKEVNENYNNFDNLPIPDNTNEIDIDKLKELLANHDEIPKRKNIQKEPQDLPTPPSDHDLTIQEQKIHDINQLLEKARNENIKLKEASKKLINTNYNFLETLEENRLTVNEIQKAKQQLETKDNHPQEEPKSNEKYQTKRLSDDPTIDQIISKDTLPLDLLSDLKSNHENTIITKPIKDIEEEMALPNNIPIDKPVTKPKETPTQNQDEDNPISFYSGAYKFSKKDFEGGLNNDDFFDNEPPKNHYFLKIIFLIVGLSLCATIIYFFIKYYGIN